MTDPRLSELARQLPALKLSTDPGDLEHHGRDWTRRWAPAPLAIAWPSSIEDVQGVVRWANAHGVGIVPSGGRTGLSGGAVAAHGELVVSLDRMNRVLAFDPIDRILTVQPGIALEAVQNAAQEQGLLYPVSFAARGSCQIGGNIATNAGGIRVIRYGNTRQWVAGLKVVTGTGELLDLNRGLIKNASGYDLRHLVIGSEGTLGIVVEATLTLTSPPPASQVMLLAVPAMDALMKVFAEARHRLRLEAFEFFTDRALHHVLAHGAQRPFDDTHPFYVVTEFDAADEQAEADALAFFGLCMDEGWVADGAIAANEAQAAALWRLREGITESLAPHKPYKNDVSVRISAVPAFMAEMEALLAEGYPHFDVVWFGHIGDGNLHINVLKPTDLDNATFVAQCEHVTALLVDTLARHGGSISAEHGIGLVKKPWLGSVRSDAEIALMRGIKAVWDPRGIMNPGKLL
ncbi:FAD/FMN-containing dehydrogenase [Luteibacter sp. UNCMF331Sha3.1]|uniref:FAD-binding oxidoreductase n=1 Tax=Luteibacter sp. UNCMF331Sha3.1 TaxID=1502760 RepID=UPI0008C0E255|nr:FAD-binding oxidoreductase [Luteibacter sp. UNCMF331Sha3.1]SEM94716.1 FAD/FMN-containing dehydrogenase [Luteibacter sp. UNCMF331Sha3.1]